MDRIEQIFNSELQNFEIGNSNDLWTKFENKRNNKSHYFFKSQIVALFVITLMALPYSINEIKTESTKINTFNSTEISLEEIPLSINQSEEKVESIFIQKENKKEVFTKKINSVNKLEENSIKEVYKPKIESNISEIKTRKIKEQYRPNNRFTLGVQVSADELLAQMEEEKQKGPAELFASKLIKKVSKASKNYISYTKIDN